MEANPILMAERQANGEPPDAETLAWWQIGLQRWWRGEGTLEVCLRLTGSYRIRARNAALIRAAGLIDNGQGNSAWQLAELLRQAVVQFRVVTLPRIQRGDAGELTPLQSALADAFASGAMPLTTQKSLYDKLKNYE